MKDTRDKITAHEPVPTVTPTEMFSEIIRLHSIKPIHENFQFNVPSAYRYVPSITSPNSIPSKAEHTRLNQQVHYLYHCGFPLPRE